MRFAALSWNLFHGRDFPPDPKLLSWRSRLLRVSESNETHLQVNRDLSAEFAATLSGWEWDVAMLQECPPRFEPLLARAAAAEPHRVLTSRNSLAPLRRLATWLNPDLIASGEGGSNLILVRRGALRGIVARRQMTIHAGKPERRTMGFVRTAAGPCIANLHATAHSAPAAAADVLRGAEAASAWAGDNPLIFGGDLNLRPAETPDLFAELEERFGLSGTTGPRAIDHILSRGLDVAEPPRALPPERREIRIGERALRLSDHSPVAAVFAHTPN